MACCFCTLSLALINATDMQNAVPIFCHPDLCLHSAKTEVHEKKNQLVRDHQTLVCPLMAKIVKPQDTHKVHKEVCEQWHCHYLRLCVGKHQVYPFA